MYRRRRPRVLTQVKIIDTPTIEIIENARKRKAEQDAEDERKRKIRAKIIEERSRTYFDMHKEQPSGPLTGEELEIEKELFNKMREVAIQDVKKHFNVPHVKKALTYMSSIMTEEEFADRDLHLYVECLKHPFPLRCLMLPDGRFEVYQGTRLVMYSVTFIFHLHINGNLQVDNNILSESYVNEDADQDDVEINYTLRRGRLAF